MAKYVLLETVDGMTEPREQSSMDQTLGIFGLLVLLC